MILVTGGTGFVGRHVVADLVARGERVRVLARRPLPADLAALGVERVAGDLRDPASLAVELAPALAGAARVVHLASIVAATGARREELDAVNVAGARAVARAAAAAGAALFVHVSSAGVYGDRAQAEPATEETAPAPRTPYERSKLAGESAVREVLEASHVAWTVLRPTGVYGPGRPATLAFLREVATRRLWLHAAPAVVHPAYVGDVVQAVRLALGRGGRGSGGNGPAPGEVYNVGGERALRYAELLALVAARLDRRLVQLELPRAAGALLGRAPVYRAVDIGKARRVLGFAPLPLERGIDETVAWARRDGLLARGGPA